MVKQVVQVVAEFVTGRGGVFGRGARISIIINSFAFLLGFMLQVLLARVLGKDHFGVWAYAISLLTVAQTISTGGVDSAFLRFLPEYGGRTECANRLRELMRWGLARASLVSGLLALLCLVSLNWFWTSGQSELRNALFASVLLIPLLGHLLVRQAYCRAFKRIFAGRFPEMIFRPIVIALGIWMLAIIGAVSATNAVLVYAAVSLLTLVWGWAMIRNDSRECRPANVLRSMLTISPNSFGSVVKQTEWNAYASSLLSIGIIQVLMIESDKLLLGIFRSVEEVGTYSVAARLASLCSFGTEALLVIAVPMLSEALHTKSKDQAQVLLNKITLGMAGATLLLAVFLMFTAPWILPLYGEASRGSWGPFAVLILGHVLLGSFGPCGSVLAVGNANAELRKVLLFTLVGVLLIAATLIPLIGMYGAAVAGMFGLGVRNIILSRVVKLKLGFDSNIIVALRWFRQQRG